MKNPKPIREWYFSVVNSDSKRNEEEFSKPVTEAAITRGSCLYRIVVRVRFRVWTGLRLLQLPSVDSFFVHANDRGQ